jgi:hypothetical protein
MTQVIKDPKGFDWSLREDKRENDGQLDIYLKPLFTSGRREFSSLSLPASKWLWERHLIAKHPDLQFSFFGVEKEPELNGRARQVASRVNSKGSSRLMMLSQDKDWSAVLKAPPLPEFDIIYADYMGTWSSPKLEDVMRILEPPTLLASRGFLILTLGLNRTNAIQLRTMAIEAGRESALSVWDDRADAREASRRASRDVIPYAKGIAEQVAGLAAENGIPLFAYPPHIYYNKGGHKPLPEGSFCFRRTT